MNNEKDNGKIFKKRETKTFSITLNKETTNRIRHLRKIAESVGDDAYKSLDGAIFKWLLEQEKHYKINKDDHKKTNLCPDCLTGYLQKRNGSKGEFLGCSNYPKCKYTQNL